MSGALLILLQLAAAQPAAVPAPTDYVDAKQLADADEASVIGAARTSMQAAQKTLLDAGVVACALGKAQSDFSPFTIVMRLDDQGRVRQTWRQGNSPLAICLQKYLRDKVVFTPPKPVFYTSLAISFTR